MSNIVEIIERQRMGYRKFNKIEIAVKYVCGVNDDSLEDLHNCPLFAARFSPVVSLKNIVAIAAEDGNIIVRNTSIPISSPESRGNYHVLKAHNNAIFDLAWACDVPKLVTSSGDHSAALWDLSGPCLRLVTSFIGHTRSVRTVAASPTDRNSFVTGSRDGSVMMWDCRGPNGEATRLYPDNTISHCHAPNLVNHTKSKGVESITSVVFTDEHTIATCAAGQGTISLWDIRRTYIGTKKRPSPKYLINHPTGQDLKGYSCLCVSSCGLRLYASCIDSNIYCFDIGTFADKPLYKYEGHTCSSFYIKHSVSSCGRYLVSGSGDGNAYLWRENDSKPAACLSGHSSEVTSAMWDPHSQFKIVTASEDGFYNVWSINPLAYDSNLPSSSCTYFPSSHKINKSLYTCRFNCKKGVSKHNSVYPQSPVKSPIKQLAKRAKIEISPSKSDFSPTAGLPNYVIDGCSPSINSHSGKKRNRPEDWLTKLRRETPPPTCKMTLRKSSSRNSRAKGNLLKFFCNQQPRRGKENGSILNGDNSSQTIDNISNTSLCCNSAKGS